MQYDKNEEKIQKLKLEIGEKYFDLIDVLGEKTVFRLINSNYMELKQVSQNRAEIHKLKLFYTLSGETFIPKYTIIVNFPEAEIPNFIKYRKKWSNIVNKHITGELKEEKLLALLKLSYVFGVFTGNDKIYNYLINTDITESDIKAFHTLKFEYHKELETILETMYNFEIKDLINAENIKIIQDNIDIIKRINQVKDVSEYNKEEIKEVINIIGSISTRNKYSEFNNSNYIGNKLLEIYCKQAKYSEAEIIKLKEIYQNSLNKRKASTIPNLKGQYNQYTYEMLRLSDPLGLVIGKIPFECCQELGGNAEIAMLHSVLSKNGRVFVIKDEKNKLIAQSWVWRNNDTICFDSIEPLKRFYKSKDKEKNKELEILNTIVDIYVKAGNELLQIDKTNYKKLLETKNINKNTYLKNVLKNVVIGIEEHKMKPIVLNNKKIIGINKEFPIIPVIDENVIEFTDRIDMTKLKPDTIITEAKQQAIIAQNLEFEKQLGIIAKLNKLFSFTTDLPSIYSDKTYNYKPNEICNNEVCKTYKNVNQSFKIVNNSKSRYF